MPGFMGKAVDKAEGSFQGQMTSVGGRAVRLRALRTVKWAEAVAGAQGLNICEIGPGRGVLAKTSKDRNHRYFAIDCDLSAIVRVERYATGFCWLRVPPMPDALPLMDAIVCENVLEHMSGYAEASHLVSACYGKLRPGGCLILRCPDIRYSRWGFWTTQDHQYVTSLQRATMLCREAGFQIERCGLAFDNMTGVAAHAAYAAKRCFPWQFMHKLFYAPWQTSPWSKLAEKTLHCYVVAVRQWTLPES